MDEKAIKLIVGLGNPGKEYENTRHNVGFMVIDELKKSFANVVQINRCKSEVCKLRYASKNLFLQKPQTYMNLSGEAVKGLCRQEQILLEEILIVYDCLDLPLGTIRIKENGSSGGQKGMESIISHLGTEKIKRLRIGINSEEKGSAVDFVLGAFSSAEQVIINQVVKKSSEAILSMSRFGIKKAMTSYNGKIVEEIKEESDKEIIKEN